MDPIRQLQSRRAGSDTRREADDFWNDFARRARDVPRDPYASSAPVHAVRMVAVATVLIAGAGGLRFLRPAEPVPPVASASAVIQSLNIAAPHDSVFIMNDEASGGTIIWIGGMAPGSFNGG